MATQLNNTLLAVLLIALSTGTTALHVPHHSPSLDTPHQAARADLLFEEYATLADIEFWDSDTINEWQSSPTTGITKPDWIMFHPDCHSNGHLHAVGLPRTVPSFEEIDTNGDGLVDRPEFHRFVARMETMSPQLTSSLELQHGIRPGDTVKWAGSPGGWPWAGDQDTTTALSFERNYDGEVYLLVRSAQDRVPLPRTGSLAPFSLGRRVRIERIQPVQSPAAVEREALSASSVFELLSGGGGMLTIRECNFLALTAMVPKAQWAAVLKQGGLTQGQFVALFHKYQFVPALVAAAVSNRSEQQQAAVDRGLTSCGVNVHCLSVHDIADTWPQLPLRDIDSVEWRRFGRMSTTKAAGWTNAMALIRALGRQLKQWREQRTGSLGGNVNTPHQERVQSSINSQPTQADHPLRVQQRQRQKAEQSMLQQQEQQRVEQASRVQQQQLKAVKAPQMQQQKQQQEVERALRIPMQQQEAEQALLVQQKQEQKEEQQHQQRIQQMLQLRERLQEQRQKAYLRELDEGIESKQRYIQQLQDQRHLLESEPHHGYAGGRHKFHRPITHSLFG